MITHFIDWLIVLWGGYLLFGILVRPTFFWETRRMLQRRALIGDRNTIIMYLVLGLMMLALGGAGFAGFL